MKSYHFATAYWQKSWQHNVKIDVNHEGMIIGFKDNIPGGKDILLPGINNCHSHAFQFAMAGLAERGDPSRPNDSFWSWRESMYQLVNNLKLEDILCISRALYSQMLLAGYTSVVEFHYLHRKISGESYSPQIKLSMIQAQAAKEAGIQLTLVPVYYNKGGFHQELKSNQLRFRMDSLKDYEYFLKELKEHLPEGVILGHGVHSLRAAALEEAIEVLESPLSTGPRHLHIAEQIKEVQEFEELYQSRPVEYLLNHYQGKAPLSLVHATHLNHDELSSLANSPHCVVVCPSTEANLGDGIFPSREFERLNGNWCIGSDSHIRVSPWAEWELMDYGQRLRQQARNPLLHSHWQDSGQLLFSQSAKGSEIASHRQAFLDFNSPFTGIVLDQSRLDLVGKREGQILNGAIFSQGGPMVKDVYVHGNQIVRDSRHIREGEVFGPYTDFLLKTSRAT